MMIGFHRAKIEAIGVDIGLDSIKMLQLQRRGGERSIAVRAAARQEISQDSAGSKDVDARIAAFCGLIGGMLRQGGFVGKRLIVALPRELAHVRNLRVARSGIALETEAKAHYPFDLAAAHLQALRAGEVLHGVEARQEIIAIAAPNQAVDSFLHQLQHGIRGIVIESIDFEPCALYRNARKDSRDQAQILVDVGSRQSQVVIGRGATINFFKAIDIGGVHLNHAVSRKLGISVEEARALRRRLLNGNGETRSDVPTRRDPVRQAVFDATRSIFDDLSRQLLSFLRYHAVTFRGPRPERLVISGGEANDPQLRQHLQAALSITVEPAKPFEFIDAGKVRPGDRSPAASEWAIALGLAMKRISCGGEVIEAAHERPDASQTPTEAIHV